jgi:hypothetical protein
MRRYSYYSSGKNDGIGCGILILLVIFAPILGYVFNVLNFIIKNIWLILIIAGIIITIRFIDKSQGDEYKE